MITDRDITLEDLGLTEEEMKLFVEGAKELFGVGEEDEEENEDGTE
jgi:hypothetical protein